MIEAEAAYYDVDDNMQLQEDMIVFVIERVLERCRNELKLLERDVAKLEAIKKPFPRISYTDAVELLNKAGEAFEWGDDFGAPHETIIGSHFESPVFVHRYPTAIKAFYMKPDPDDAKVVLGADLLAPEGYGEIIGGGRIDDLELLEQRWLNIICPARPLSGTWICDGMVRFLTRDSAWALNERWHGFAGLIIFMNPFPSRVCCIKCTLEIHYSR